MTETGHQDADFGRTDEDNDNQERKENTTGLMNMDREYTIMRRTNREGLKRTQGRNKDRSYTTGIDSVKRMRMRIRSKIE
jgi:hypothetical protein